MKDESVIDKYNKPFPKMLRDLMGSKITQKQLAEEIGVSRQAISQYMNGETTPTIDKFELLIAYFRVSADYMLGLSKVSTKNLNIKEIHEKTGLSEKAIEVLIMEKTVYSEGNFLKTVNFLLEQMKGLQSFSHDEVFEYYHFNQDILTLIDEFLNTSCELVHQQFNVSSGSVSLTDDDDLESRYNVKISAEEIFVQVMTSKIIEELKKQRIYNLKNNKKYVDYDNTIKYLKEGE